ncbi:MAG: hypothetical protein HY884_09720, partial [Deltaproteobacteria bacterium]|nr:hypothetical protein [Deltaproteobacteria bacterium]
MKKLDMPSSKKLLLTAAILCGAALGADAVFSKWSSYHNFDGKCLDCHLDVPKDGEDPGIFLRDLTGMCAECHKDALKVSHPVDMKPTMDVPSAMQLDSRGAVTCITCHFAHKDGYGGSHIRVKFGGAGLCVQCHGEVEASLHSASLGTAHAASAVNASLGNAEIINILDPLSIKCLSCHDSVSAFDAAVSTPWNPPGYYHNGSPLNLSHPIGGLYSDAKEKYKASLRDLDMLPKQIKLFGGKIGCATCHDPFSKGHSRLVIS